MVWTNGNQTFRQDWPFVIYSTIEHPITERALDEFNLIITDSKMADGADEELQKAGTFSLSDIFGWKFSTTFQDVPLISETLRLVEAKLSWPFSLTISP